MTILPIIEDSASELTAIFKDLHAHPEPGWQEALSERVWIRSVLLVNSTMSYTVPASLVPMKGQLHSPDNGAKENASSPVVPPPGRNANSAPEQLYPCSL